MTPVIADDKNQNRIGINHSKQNGIRKAVDQTTPNAAFNDWKLFWILKDAVDGGINFRTQPVPPDLPAVVRSARLRYSNRKPLAGDTQLALTGATRAPQEIRMGNRLDGSGCNLGITLQSELYALRIDGAICSQGRV